MPVKHAVLGLVVERRGYGYELASRLNDRLGSAFEVPTGTVGAAIKTLKDAEHIEVVKKEMRGDQMRVWYGATPAGRAHFEAWMDEPLVREPMRGELYLKFAVTDSRRVPILRESFERLELECLADIAMHTRSPNLADELTDPVPFETATRLLLDSGRLDRLNADRAFIRRTLGVLRWAEETGTVPRAMLLEAVPASG